MRRRHPSERRRIGAALSFSDRRVSKNAMFTTILGVCLILGYVILAIISIATKGKLSLFGGLVGSLFMLLAAFGVLWGVLSFDEIRTGKRFKVPGLVLNIVAIFIGFMFMML